MEEAELSSGHSKNKRNRARRQGKHKGQWRQMPKPQGLGSTQVLSSGTLEAPWGPNFVTFWTMVPHTSNSLIGSWVSLNLVGIL